MWFHHVHRDHGTFGCGRSLRQSLANIVKDLLVCLSLGLGNAGGILVGNLLGRGDFRQAKAMGDRMCVLVAVVGTATGLLIVAARPLALQWANLTPEPHGTCRSCCSSAHITRHADA